MQNVFIDTCVFEKEWFYRGPRIKTLFNAASKGRIRIVLPDLTEFEVIKHLESKCEEHDGSGGLHKLDNSMLKDLPEGKKLINGLRSLQSHLKESVTKMFLGELKRASVRRIKIPADLNVLKVIEAYKNREAPFSEKKKDEFPDAFVLETLEEWCEDNDEECTILSKDSDMEHYVSERLHYKDYEVFVQELINEEEHITTKLATDILDDNRFVNALTDWTQDVLDNDVYYCAALQIENINDFSIKNIDIYAEKDDLRLVGYYDDTCVFEIMVTITTEIEVWHPDYDSAYWDSEDHKYYFLDDNVMDTVTSELIVPVEISADMNGILIDVESINNGDWMKEKDVLNSFVSAWN